MAKAAAAALLLAAFVGVAAGAFKGPSWYSCDPSTCTGDCVCPSTSPPGSLSPKDTPQFVLVTHDDAVHTQSNYLMRLVTDGNYNPNGCNVPATYFVSNDQNLDNCTLIKALFNDNNEIATHTKSHKKYYPPGSNMPDAFTGNITDEIVGQRIFLNESCGVPLEELVGFRSPFLIHHPLIRQILSSNGFMYDSTIVEPSASWSTSPSLGDRMWPYNMSNGIPQDCSYTGVGVGSCQQSEKYNLFEVPMWSLGTPGDDNAPAYTMDYLDDGSGVTDVEPDNLYNFLKANFDATYEGNRAPMPVYIHSTYLNDKKVGAITSFIKYALGKGDVYFVTMRQLLDWMRNPVPLSQISSTLKCKQVELTAPKMEFCRTYVIPPEQEGQFYAIANQFDVAQPKDILDLNGMHSASELKAGMKIKIPPYNAGCTLWQKSGLPEPTVTPNPEAFTPTAWYRAASIATQQPPAAAAPAPITAEVTPVAASPTPAVASPAAAPQQQEQQQQTEVPTTTPAAATSDTTTTATTGDATSAPATATASTTDGASTGGVNGALIGGVVGGVVGAVAIASVAFVLVKKHMATKAASLATSGSTGATAHITTTAGASKAANLV